MKKILLIIISFFSFIGTCYAVEPDYSDDICSYTSEAYLQEVFEKIKVSYDFKYDDNNNVSFDISIFNLTDDVYVEITSDNEYSNTITYSNTKDGTYTFNVTNLNLIETYTFNVYPVKFGCFSSIGKLELIKPRKNELSEKQYCNYEELKGFYYCQEWLTSNFYLTDYEAYQLVIEEYEKSQMKTTTKCVSCEINEKNQESVKSFKKIQYLGLGILAFLAIIDIIYIIRKTKKIKASEL